MGTDAGLPSWSWGSGGSISDERLPRHHQLHLREKSLAFGLLLGRGQLVVERRIAPQTDGVVQGPSVQLLPIPPP